MKQPKEVISGDFYNGLLLLFVRNQRLLDIIDKLNGPLQFDHSAWLPAIIQPTKGQAFVAIDQLNNGPLQFDHSQLLLAFVQPTKSQRFFAIDQLLNSGPQYKFFNVSCKLN